MSHLTWRLRAPVAALCVVGILLVQVASSRDVALDENPRNSDEWLTDGRFDDSLARYSPDGARIVYVSNRSGKQHLFLTTIGGGEPRQLTAPDYSASSPAWSPDGEQIAFVSAKDGGSAGVWLIRTNGGEPARLTAPSYVAFRPDWSPDGRHIVFMSDKAGSMDVYTIPVSGGEPKQITNHPGNEWMPRWSPDGRHIAFYTTWERRMTDIWVVAAEGGEPRQVTDDPAEDFHPAWSPDGKWIAFLSSRGGDHANVWIVSASGGKARQVSNSPFERFFPSWSPDGKSIIFTALPTTHFFSVAVTGEPPVRLASGHEGVTPTLSPDGKLLLYASDGHDLLTVPVAGGKARTLAGSKAREGHPWYQSAPAWSPDGQSVAFVRGPGGWMDTNDLWLVSKTTRKARRLTQMGHVDNPVWCDEGKSLAFSAKGHLWKISTSGGTPVQLTTAPDGYTATAYSAARKQLLLHRSVKGVNKLFLFTPGNGVFEPFPTETVSAEGARWSPDGSTVAFLSGDGGQHDLYVMSSQGGPARRLTNTPERESAPSWSADGRRLVFGKPDGRSRIQRIMVDPSG